ncbi:phage shock protein A [Arthrobacter pigmenti]|uniref:Phage shock protein A n=1 Tax=Arthrobacter pigmenti TaxID=271432 RepID=A0A846RSM1_9MICC|nr:phage shock protein A [Arthrobacter pigmenti]
MSVRRRITRIIAARRNAPEPVDPIAALDSSQRQQEEQLDRARRSVADLAAVRHRVDTLARQAAAELNETNRQAEQAVQNNDDDAARHALKRGIEVRKRLDSLTHQRDDVDRQVRSLEADLYRLETALQENTVRYQSLKAQHGATQAAQTMHGAVSASAGSSIEAARAAREAEEEARRLRHRQAAQEELEWSDPNSAKLDRAFEELESRAEAERELRELKDRARDSRPGQR